MSTLNHQPQQDLLVGSSNIFSGKSLRSKDEYILHHASENQSLPFFLSQFPDIDIAIAKFKQSYLDYRTNWKSQPLTSCLNGDSQLSIPPLCVDIEVASICDLACPFCYRSYIATPDKLIEDELAYAIIDQASELGVPSMKFNWRGEPLLHPRLEKFISYAKQKGILETIINTNATQLTSARAKSLIDSGIDVIIYSFDGASKETYEKNRPGRFSYNSFQRVVENIRSFSNVRASLGKNLPFTKIQMILTSETFNEQSEFYNLFHDCVDSVTVTQYSERGGNLDDLNEQDRDEIQRLCQKYDIDSSFPISYLKSSTGEISISVKRKPCEQPFQRLLVTYDGRVSMCCYDWGAKYTCGQVRPLPSLDPHYDKRKVYDSVKAGLRGFDKLGSVQLPEQYNAINSVIGSLRNIWNESPIVAARKAHINGCGLPSMCEKCTFKDTYEWLS